MIMTIPIETEGYEGAKVGDYYALITKQTGGKILTHFQVTEIRNGFIHLQSQNVNELISGTHEQTNKNSKL